TLMTVVVTGNRVLAKMMVFFGALAMFLGAMGVYGVMSHLVSQRTREIGIRTALGASPPQVMALVIGQGLNLALIGVAVGAVYALASTRPLAMLLYGVTTSYQLTFIVVPIVFVALAGA